MPGNESQIARAVSEMCGRRDGGRYREAAALRAGTEKAEAL